MTDDHTSHPQVPGLDMTSFPEAEGVVDETNVTNDENAELDNQTSQETAEDPQLAAGDELVESGDAAAEQEQEQETVEEEIVSNMEDESNEPSMETAPGDPVSLAHEEEEEERKEDIVITEDPDEVEVRHTEESEQQEAPAVESEDLTADSNEHVQDDVTQTEQIEVDELSDEQQEDSAEQVTEEEDNVQQQADEHTDLDRVPNDEIREYQESHADAGLEEQGSDEEKRIQVESDPHLNEPGQEEYPIREIAGDSDDDLENVSVELDEDDLELQRDAAELERDMREMIEAGLMDSIALSEEIGEQMNQLQGSFVKMQQQQQQQQQQEAHTSDPEMIGEIEKLRFALQMTEQQLHREVQLRTVVAQQKDAVDAQLKEIMAECEQLKFEREDLQRALDRAKENIAKQQEQLDQERQEAATLRDALDEAKVQHEESIGALKNQHEMEKNDLVIQHNREVERLQQEISAQKTASAQARKKLVELRASYKQDLSWMKQLKEQFATLQEDRRALRQELMLMRQRQK